MKIMQHYLRENAALDGNALQKMRGRANFSGKIGLEQILRIIGEMMEGGR